MAACATSSRLWLLLAGLLLCCATAKSSSKDVRYLQGAIKKIDDIAEEAIALTGVPGLAVGVVLGDKVMFSKGYGTKQLGSSEPVTPKTVFQLASVSKSISASALAMAMYGSGSIFWTDPIVQYLPWFKLNSSVVTDMVTIADMYSHRSGLPDHAGDLVEDLGFSAEDVLNALSNYALGPFRDHYAYTNWGLQAGALAVAAALNTTFEQLATAFVRGLGMNSTAWTFEAFVNSSNRVTPHTWQYGQAKPARDPDCEACNGKFVPTLDVAGYRDSEGQSAAGGACASLKDVLTFVSWYMKQSNTAGSPLQDVISFQNRVHPRPETPEARARVVASASAGGQGGPSWYGLGVNMGIDSWARVRMSHSGAFNLGTATAYFATPVMDGGKGLAVVVLSNGAPIGAVETVGLTFLDYVNYGKSDFGVHGWLQALFPSFKPFFVFNNSLTGRTPPPQGSCTPARDWADYAGTYCSSLYGNLTVVATASSAGPDSPTLFSLTAYLGPSLSPGGLPRAYPLTCWGGDQFSLESVGENAVGRSPVTFAGSAYPASQLRGGGPPASVEVWWLNRDVAPLGVFARVA